MSFELNRNLPTQQHFYIVEIDLPIITGLCEVETGIEGFGTPLSCPIQDGTSATEIKTYYFSSRDAPDTLPIEILYNCITGVIEDPTEITNDGLAIRGRASITFKNIINDPNLERQSGRNAQMTGSFFGKFSARNIFENRPVRIKKYRLTPSINLATDAETTYYIGRSLNNNGGTFRLECADALSQVDFDQSQWPLPTNGTLRADVTDLDASLPVDSSTDWLQKPVPYVIIVGDELMPVTAVTNNQTATASLTIGSRVQSIGPPIFNNFLSLKRNSEHSAGDSVQICYHADGENIAQVFSDILTDVGIDPSIINLVDWYNEVGTWLATPLMSSVFHEVGDTNDILTKILRSYMIKMWQDPIANEIKIRAVSAFQPPTAELIEGRQIDFESVKVQQLEDRRYSRALVSYNKPYLADTDEDVSYKKSALGINLAVEGPNFYDKEKTKTAR